MITSRKLLSIYMILCCGCCGVSMGEIVTAAAVVSSAAVYKYMTSESAESTVDDIMKEIFGVEAGTFNNDGVKVRDTTKMTLRYLIAEAAIFCGLFEKANTNGEVQAAYNTFIDSLKNIMNGIDENYKKAASDKSWAEWATDKASAAVDIVSDQSYICIDNTPESNATLDKIITASQKLNDAMKELYNANYVKSNQTDQISWRILICNTQRIVNYFTQIKTMLETEGEKFKPVYMYVPRKRIGQYVSDALLSMHDIDKSIYATRLKQIANTICERDKEIYNNFIKSREGARIERQHSTGERKDAITRDDSITSELPLQRTKSKEELSELKARSEAELMQKEAKAWWHNSRKTVNMCLDITQNTVSAIQDQTIYNTVKAQFVVMYKALYNAIDSYASVKSLLRRTTIDQVHIDQVHIDQNDISRTQAPNLGTICLQMTRAIQTMINEVNALRHQHNSQPQHVSDLSLVAQALQGLYNHVDGLLKYYKYGEGQVIDLDIATRYESDLTLEQLVEILTNEMDTRYNNRSTVEAAPKAVHDMGL